MNLTLMLSALIVLCHVFVSYGAGIQFKLSARNLPGKTDPFAEVRTLEEKTDTIDLEQNPDWGETFEFNTNIHQHIEIEIRDDVDGGKDHSLGWARIHHEQFMEKRTFHVGLWTDDDKQIYMGTLRITVTAIW